MGLRHPPERRSFLLSFAVTLFRVGPNVIKTNRSFLPRLEANPGLACWLDAVAARNYGNNLVFSTAAAPKREPRRVL